MIKTKTVHFSYFVAQELARQSPEGVKVKKTAGQVNKLELFHLRVDKKLSGREGRSAWP